MPVSAKPTCWPGGNASPSTSASPHTRETATSASSRGRAKLLRIVREDPSRADWWIEQEASVSHRTGPDGRHCESLKRFRLEETYAELRTAALAQRDLFDDPVSALPADEADIGDCLCTD